MTAERAPCLVLPTAEEVWALAQLHDFFTYQIEAMPACEAGAKEREYGGHFCPQLPSCIVCPPTDGDSQGLNHSFSNLETKMLALGWLNEYVSRIPSLGKRQEDEHLPL